MNMLTTLLIIALASGALLFVRAPLWLWSVVTVACLATYTHWSATLWGPVLMWLLFVPLLVVLNLRPVRRRLLSAPLLAVFRRVLPSMSSTEREALEAGTVGWDGELFSGRPDWKTLVRLPCPATHT